MKQLARYVARLWADDPVATLCAGTAVAAILCMLTFIVVTCTDDLLRYGW